MKKRRLRRVLGLLLLGAAMNVAVAWGFSLWHRRAQFDAQLTADIRRQYFRLEAEDRSAPGGDPLWIDGAWRAGGLEVVVTHRPASGGEKVHSLRAGWPVRSLGGRASISPGGPGARGPTYSWAVPLPDELTLEFELPSRKTLSKPSARVLPLQPMWPGFVVNTALYAAGLGVGLGAWGAVRRWSRFLRGRCPACGYDLRGVSVGCSECGWRRQPLRRL